MEIIISFLIGICILYIVISAFVYLMKPEMKSIPKLFRPGAWIAGVAALILVVAFFSLLAYAVGNDIYESLIK